MADIELVIKIPEDSYKATCNGWMSPPDVESVVQGIKNGVPLPEGHGRLIDETDLKTLFGLDDRLWWENAVEEFTNLPTIIEADKTDDTISNEGSNHEFSDSIAKAAKDMFGINLKKGV